MKRYAYCAFLMMFMVIPLLGIPYEQTSEYAQKQAIMNEKAAKFKAETGFKGSISFDHRFMQFSHLSGTFNGMEVTTPQDTTSMLQIFTQIISTISPYIAASETDLHLEYISLNESRSAVRYRQIVNGYRFDGCGWLSVSYLIGQNKISVTNCTVPIRENFVAPTVTRERALEIYRDSIVGYENQLSIPVTPRADLKYYDVDQHIRDLSPSYRLCWIISGERFIVIDAVSEAVYVNSSSYVVHNRSVNVTGSVKFTQNDDGYTSVNTFIPDTLVQAVCDSNTQFHLTNNIGECTFTGTNIDVIRAALQSESFTTYDYDIPVINSQPIAVDSLHVAFYFDDSEYSGSPCNVFYHATDYLNWYNRELGQFEILLEDSLNILTNYNDSGNFHSGYEPRRNRIYVSSEAGVFSSPICHEVTHAIVYNTLDGHMFCPNPESKEDTEGCMDEAISIYLPCSYRDSALFRRPDNYIDLSQLNCINTIYNAVVLIDTLTSVDLNEEFYRYYWCGESVASAWWEIGSRLGYSVFDQRISDALFLDVMPDDSLRCMPRYFYNILMRNSSLTDQTIIQEAYSNKGLYFTPKVVSAGIANPTEDKDKNMFRVGDPIYMKAIDCPQNTPVTIYIVEDQEYTDGMSISTLNPLCQVNGTSNSDGVWSSSTPLMTALTPGDYDILVDIGNNGVLHFAYEGANVRDGFDGLDEPGFTIYDDGIDVVLALDLSQSMIEECSNLQQLTKRFISAMLPGDKINVFGFNEGTPPNWSGGYTNLSPTPVSQLYTITPSNQSSLINSVGCPNAEGNTDLLVPFTYGYHRFDASSTRKKAFVLLSDGEHYPTIDLLNPNNPNVSNPHRMSHVSNGINSNYNTRDIRCFTMRFGDISTGTINMNNIASWGDGIAYRVPILSSMPLLVSRLMNSIRGNPPSYDNNQSIPPNSNQTLPIVVDDMAGNLRTTLIWNTSGTTSVNEFTLTSPSGIIYSQPEGIGNSTYKYDIDTPESGVWTATITNHYNSAQTYSMISELDSDLTVCIDDIPTSIPVDCPMLLNVSVSDYTTPITNALVTAVLKKGDWELSVDLYDDGCHNDGSSEDGMYGNYLYAYADIVNTFPYHQQYGDFDLSVIVDIPSRYGKRIVNQSLYLSPANQNSYPQTERILHDGWNWVGYPRLQRDDVGSSIPYANASLSPVLTDIVSSDGIAEYRDDKWSYYGLQSLKSDYGYKLRIKDTDSVRLFELGSIIDTLHTHNLKAGQWNWVTYPCYETVYPWEALSGVIDNIDYIMAESWSMKKDGDVWIHDGYARPRLMYGDSIMIWAVDDCTFVWNSPLTTPIVINPRKPSNFVFEDKPDYETIMIESIEGNPEFQEIGVFQDNVCIGAKVNEAYPIQILAYSTPEEDGGGQLSFMLYSENKGVRSASPITIDQSSITAEESTITPIRYGFRVINLKTNYNETPPDFALHSNYPNPFNPSTTIRFSLPKTAPVRLVIYNIRGQKVKDLLNETLAYGNHSIVWNGRDDKNRLVASGVYFARLEQNGVSKVSKMMMLK